MFDKKKDFLSVFAFFFLLTSQAQAYTVIIAGNPEEQRKIERKIEAEVHRQGQGIFEDLTADVKPYSPKLATELSKIKANIPNIAIRQSSYIQTKGNNKISCMMKDTSTWTAEPGKRPTITMGNDLGQDLFIHEVVSASGIIDDEYQVTGPLLAFRQLKQQGKIDRPVGKVLLDSIEIKKRTTSPQYKIVPQDEQCYDQNGSLVSGSGDGTATGVGGGGNKDALMLKQILVRWAPEYWAQYFPNKPIDPKFMSKVIEIGIEPLPVNYSITKVFPFQMDFTFSKRTKKHVVRMKMRAEYFNEHQYLIDITDRIYNHLVTELKSDRPFQYKHCIYGIELAHELKAVDDKTFWNKLGEEFDLKEKLYKYYLR